MNSKTGLEPNVDSGDSDLAPSLGGSLECVWTPDGRALKALFEAFYSPATGWRPMPVIAPDALAFGISAGVMFESQTLEHDALVAAIQAVVRQLTPHEMGAAFIASLSTRRLDWRSRLGSYAFARHLTPHPFERWELNCGVCGASPAKAIDLNVLSFSRYKWGGSCHTEADYAWFDLSRAVHEGAATPTKEDWRVWREILLVIRSLPTGKRASDLEKALSKVFKSNQNERRTLIEILAIAGVLEFPEYPGYLNSFIRHDFSHHIQVSMSDWDYPACRWRSTGEVNEEALAYWFGSSRDEH